MYKNLDVACIDMILNVYIYNSPLVNSGAENKLHTVATRNPTPKSKEELVSESPMRTKEMTFPFKFNDGISGLINVEKAWIDKYGFPLLPCAPWAVVRVTQTVAGPALRVEDSGSSTLNYHISTISERPAELDIQVDLNAAGLTISVIPASSELISTEVSPQPQGIFHSMVSHWAHDHVWPSSASDANSPLLYSEESNSTHSRSLNSCHSDILDLNILLSSLQTPPRLDSASSDPIELDIPFSVPDQDHSMSLVTTRNVDNTEEMQDCSDAVKGETRSFPVERVIVSLLVNTPVKFMRRPMLRKRQGHSFVESLTVKQRFRGRMIDYDIKSEYMVTKPTLALIILQEIMMLGVPNPETQNVSVQGRPSHGHI
ncbi:hypothetical protein K435DRAFT_807528 [Dendrothele bispora CBS 962.96]|uniref:Uncharacterized protein n=1 Tax=Dendrothele bispora (strain CBS 962.96) TaxID=1314807 RepID=A0A4S8L5U2_DENBC|nr:hypothetical protein K435DRAFT_807528 [Dendrothele bispora CBS 962.96]